MTYVLKWRQYIAQTIWCPPHYTVPSSRLLQYVTEMCYSMMVFVSLHKMSRSISRELIVSHDEHYKLDPCFGKRKEPSRAEI